MASVAQLLRLKAAQTAWSTEASASVYDANATRAYRHVGALIVAHMKGARPGSSPSAMMPGKPS